MNDGAELERRYRGLLRWYPWSHRRVYEEEMVAVLVAGARPGQRRPTTGESVNLVVSGLRARAHASVTSLASPAWVDAAAVFGLLAALVLLSQRAVRLLAPLGGPDAPIEAPQYLRALGWSLVVLALLAGLRRPAATLAWVSLLGEAVLLAERYGTDPVHAVYGLWPVALGLVAAAALTVPAPRRHAVAVLGPARLLTFVLGVGAVQAIVVINHRQRATWFESGTMYVFYGLEHRSEAVLNLWLAVVAVGVLAAGLAALTLPAAVRWRIAVLLAPVAVLAAMVKLTLGGWAYSNGHMGHPIYLVPVQWTLLVTVPLVAFGLGALGVQWRDQLSRLTALGRSVDRERLDG